MITPMSQAEIVIVGDIAFETDITLFGTKTSLGGSGYYASVGASLYSDKVGVVAHVGKDFPVESLAHKKIDTSGVHIASRGRSAHFTVEHHPDQSRTFTAERGVTNDFAPHFPKDYAYSRCIHLATALPHHYLQWIEHFKTKALNPDILSADAFELFCRQYPSETMAALHSVDLIFLNEEELDILRQYGEVSFQVPMILKKGRQGAVYIDKEEQITIPAPEVNVIDTTGAGDVLAGTFLALRNQGTSVRSALEKAVRVASLSTTEFGVDHLQLTHDIVTDENI